MAKAVSREHSRIGPRNVRPIAAFDANEWAELQSIGISFGAKPSEIQRNISMMIEGVGMDALTPSVTAASIPTPIQFLQNWLPGFVQIVTAARKIDELVGISTTGSWEDEEIVQWYMERLGTSVPYGDYTNVPLASWNVDTTVNTVVRFEEGMQVGKLEDARASRINVNSAAEKRGAATLALEIQRNSVGFFGYNGGNNKTYGFLNEPSLPAYSPFPAGASTFTTWATKTYLEIVADIRLGIAKLRTQSNEVINPDTDMITMALSTSTVDYLSVVSTFGNSVRDWLTKTYPKVRVVSAPELNLAHASTDNVVYFYAETVSDGSTDDHRVFLQPVPTKFMMLGVQTKAKSYEEDYSNATAGIICKRQWAVVRYYGN